MRGPIALLVLVVMCGCSTPPSATPSAPDDATIDITLDATVDATVDATDADVVDVYDASVDVARDASDATDASLDRADAADVTDALDDATAATDDVVIDPGMCGPNVRTCLCGCGGNGVCNNACIARDVDCGGCLYTAATRCCVEEARLFEACIDASMCADDGCVMLRCATEQRRFDGCFATAQMSVESCRVEVRACLGSDYPMIRCVRPAE